jgi:hypothetical protein
MLHHRSISPLEQSAGSAPRAAQNFVICPEGNDLSSSPWIELRGEPFFSIDPIVKD